MTKYRNKRNQFVGETIDGVYYRSAQGRKHKLKSPPGWAIDERILVAIAKEGVESIVIKDTDNGITYTCTVDAMLNWGFAIDRGHGKQIALVMSRWTVEQPGAKQAKLL